MTRHPARPSRFLTSTALTALLAVSLGGCLTPSFDGPGALGGGGLLASGKTAEAKTPTTDEEWRSEAKATGERYRKDPGDVDAATRYAQSLRKTGQRAQAVAVLQQASIRNPQNQKILGAYGRALADTGDFDQALDVLGRAHSPDQPDWRILSAQGAVLDQMGRFDEARRYYETALKIVPEEASVLSNLGLSYALSKQLPKAEAALRRASANAAGDRRIRQNLALVVGLQGRFKEAEQIAIADLPANEAASNVAYLKQMMDEQRATRGNARGRAGAQTIGLADPS
jgi:Flp pilus assembly protein TadD